MVSGLQLLSSPFFTTHPRFLLALAGTSVDLSGLSGGLTQTLTLGGNYALLSS